MSNKKTITPDSKSWVGEKVIVKGTRNLLWLMPVTDIWKIFNVTYDDGLHIKVNTSDSLLLKENYELYP